ncbi:MAG: Gp49 family protein [Candidatus Thorarchaeota archaeon]
MEKHVLEQLINKDSIRYEFYGDKTTICFVATLKGFEIIGTAFCLDINKFDVKLGKKSAFKNAIKQLEQYEGYRINYEKAFRDKVNEHIENMLKKINPIIKKTPKKLNDQISLEEIKQEEEENCKKNANCSSCEKHYDESCLHDELENEQNFLEELEDEQIAKMKEERKDNKKTHSLENLKDKINDNTLITVGIKKSELKKYEERIKKIEKEVNDEVITVETAHVNADGLLIRFLKELGFDTIADTFNDIDKWYS